MSNCGPCSPQPSAYLNPDVTLLGIDCANLPVEVLSRNNRTVQTIPHPLTVQPTKDCNSDANLANLSLLGSKLDVLSTKLSLLLAATCPCVGGGAGEPTVARCPDLGWYSPLFGDPGEADYSPGNTAVSSVDPVAVNLNFVFGAARPFSNQYALEFSTQNPTLYADYVAGTQNVTVHPSYIAANMPVDTTFLVTLTLRELSSGLVIGTLTLLIAKITGPGGLGPIINVTQQPWQFSGLATDCSQY